MNTEERLTGLYARLSSMDRGRMILQARKRGDEPEPLIYTTTPGRQDGALNRLIRLMNAINTELTYAIVVLAEQVRQIELKFAWLTSLMLFGNDVDIFGNALLARTKDRTMRAEVQTLMKRAPSAPKAPLDLTLPLDECNTSAEGLGTRLVRALLIAVTTELQHHWVDLRRIERVIDERIDAFDGEDPLCEDARGFLDAAIATCMTITEGVQIHIAAFKLVEPTEDEVAFVRAYLEKLAADPT